MRNRKPCSVDYSAGFTLIELLVVIALTIVFATITVLNLNSYARSRHLEGAFNELVAVIRDTQSRAITQENGQSWSIRFINPLGGQGSYEVFSGQSYSSTSIVKTYFLKNGIEFSDPLPGSTKDLNFISLSGKINSQTNISLRTSNSSSSIKTIIIETSGLIKVLN
ncbi:MAG: prepilin-type N-terminal cleavage/methylation domain-containing protein [Patescibacteria group bacterium]|nr:prepilin-type N-terminal cleavage/methylation domain-containing protein [Patescibacteria group bacterium]